jgi:O-antigen/teichoic acid export membrane protein
MKKQALALIFANGINFLVNFAMSPFLARQLSYHDNGTYNQVNLINGYASILFSLGISSVINLLFSEYKDDQKRIMSSTFWIQLVSSILCSLLIFCFSDGFGALLNNPDLPYYLSLYIPSTFFIILTNLSIYYYIFYKKTWQLSILTVVVNSIKIAATYYAINNLQSLFYAIVFQNILNGLQCLVHAILLRKELFPIKKPHWADISYVLKLSSPYLLMSFIGYSILYINGIIISNQLGVEPYAIYRNGAIEIPFIATLYANVTAVALPFIVEYTRAGKTAELLALKRKISTTVAAIIYPVVFFFIFNGQDFIHLYLGDKYIQSGLVFSIYNIAVLIRINSYSDILTILKKPGKIILSNLISLMTGIIGSLILINVAGVNGAAIGFVLSLAVMSLLMIHFTCKELSVGWGSYFEFKRLSLIFLVCLVAALASWYFASQSIMLFFISGAIYLCIVYIGIFKLKLIDIDILPVRAQKIIQRISFLN